MTSMVPPLHGDTTVSEKKVFNRIKDSDKMDQYFCLHSVGVAHHQKKTYGECDFIIIGPLGVFVLEVKGGKVARNNGVWRIGWEESGRYYESTEGPFKQAQSLKWSLLDVIKKRTSDNFSRKILIGWGVAFPDISFNEKDPEWSQEMIYDHRDLHDEFISYLNRLAFCTREAEKRGGRIFPDQLSTADIGKVVECLRHDFDVVPMLGNFIADSNRELIALSEQQYKVLTYVQNPLNPRLMISGAAGTGKSLIAAEAARRFYLEGKDVLFLCFNKLLADFLQRDVNCNGSSITVKSLHKYMRETIELAGMLKKLDGGARDKLLFDKHFPEVFSEAVIELCSRDEFRNYDVIVIDEAQDILFSPVIDTVDWIVRGGFENGSWVIFYDPGFQAEMFGKMDSKVLDSLQQFRPSNLMLSENFRNPPEIVDELCNVVGIEKPVCMREKISNVDYVTFKNIAEQGKKLRALLVNLLRDGVEPSSITILSGCSPEKSCVINYPPDIGKKIAHLQADSSVSINKITDEITACSTFSFKGLENDIIILTDLPEPTPDREWEKSVVYVGMTRCKTKLYVLLNESYLDGWYLKYRGGV